MSKSLNNVECISSRNGSTVNISLKTIQLPEYNTELKITENSYGNSFPSQQNGRQSVFMTTYGASCFTFAITTAFGAFKNCIGSYIDIDGNSYELEGSTGFTNLQKRKIGWMRIDSTAVSSVRFWEITAGEGSGADTIQMRVVLTALNASLSSLPFILTPEIPFSVASLYVYST